MNCSAGGNKVTGIARNPVRVADRSGLSLIAADVMDMNRLAPAIAGHDAVICAYSPGHGMGPQIYKDCIEAAWANQARVQTSRWPLSN